MYSPSINIMLQPSIFDKQMLNLEWIILETNYFKKNLLIQVKNNLFSQTSLEHATN